MGLDVNEIRLGILGGGQLGRMLALASQSMGFSPRLLAHRPSEPAARVLPESAVTAAAHWDGATLRRFFEGCTHVVFENEFLDVALLQEASQGLALQWTPELSVFAPLQDKLEQKKILGRLKIPTPRFIELRGDELQDPSRLTQAFPRGVVLKWARWGYDGHGVLLIPRSLFGKPGTWAQAREFLARGRERGARVFAEAFLERKREFSTVGARARDGLSVQYPVVETIQENGICREVWGPARVTSRLKSTQERKLQAAWEKCARALDWTGVLAIEWIQDRKGGFWVNELAPRVHNTAHWTQDAGVTSQFENHIRAALELGLGQADWGLDHSSRAYFAMRNLLGPRGPAATQWQAPLPVWAHLHDYRKQEVKTGRKMGHINAIFDPKTPFARARKWLADLESKGWRK